MAEPDQDSLQIEPASNFYAQAKAGAVGLRHHVPDHQRLLAADIPTTARRRTAIPGLALVWAVSSEKDTTKDVIARLNAAMLERWRTRKRASASPAQESPRAAQSDRRRSLASLSKIRNNR